MRWNWLQLNYLIWYMEREHGVVFEYLRYQDCEYMDPLGLDNDRICR